MKTPFKQYDLPVLHKQYDLPALHKQYNLPALHKKSPFKKANDESVF